MPTTERQCGARDQGNNREMADEKELKEGIILSLMLKILPQVVDEMRQMGENVPINTNVQEVVNEGNVRVIDRALAIENDLEEQNNVDTKPFRAPSYGGHGNRNGRGNLQGNAEKPRMLGRAYALESQEVRDASGVIEGESTLVSLIYKSCAMIVGEHTLYADLIVLPMRGFEILLEMDWLSSNRVSLDCFP
ncbi:hypothetical protein RJ639_002214 [Escallonia herrerae]|uniref:Uncharacterized protein n=1 Tax=Escallonia herrerae TaxID=1293975 RepID=A0AA88XEI8_9ASTE|nr:hypothetical protein RJ639_002214 [Escallonia herrerae]